MRTWIYPLIAVALATSGLAAHADTISTFSLSDVTFISGATATGTVAIDTTTGLATNVDMTYNLSGATENFAGVSFQTVGFNHYTVDSMGSGGDVFSFALPETLLVGYAGSSLCSLDIQCGFNSGSALLLPGGTPSDTVLSGFLDYDSSVTTGMTPEPTSIVLLGSGLIAVAGVFRRRLLRG